MPKKSLRDKVTAQLTIREMQYLDKIKESDLAIYGDILKELTRYRPDFTSVKKYTSSRTADGLTLLPTAPKVENMI